MWSLLPTSGFIKGRAAVEEELRAGDAVFVLRSEGRLVGEAIPADIPQFAVQIDNETGTEVPCVLIQAASNSPEFGTLIAKPVQDCLLSSNCSGPLRRLKERKQIRRC